MIFIELGLVLSQKSKINKKKSRFEGVRPAGYRRRPAVSADHPLCPGE